MAKKAKKRVKQRKGKELKGKEPKEEEPKEEDKITLASAVDTVGKIQLYAASIVLILFGLFLFVFGLLGILSPTVKYFEAMARVTAKSVCSNRVDNQGRSVQTCATPIEYKGPDDKTYNVTLTTAFDYPVDSQIRIEAPVNDPAKPTECCPDRSKVLFWMMFIAGIAMCGLGVFLFRNRKSKTAARTVVASTVAMQLIG